ncbi:MAG: hypothetical protein ACRC9X_01030, partial [Bacteroidales bacterium]
FYENEVFDKVFSKNAFSDIDVVYGNIILEYSFGQYFQKPQPLENITQMMVTPHPATFVRSELMKAYKFDTQFKIAADYDLMRKLYLANKKFQHIDCTISVFEAETGISATAHFLCAKELAVVHNTYGTWTYNRIIAIMRVKQFIKFFIPKRILQKRMKCFLERNKIISPL